MTPAGATGLDQNEAAAGAARRVAALGRTSDSAARFDMATVADRVHHAPVRGT